MINERDAIFGGPNSGQYRKNSTSIPSDNDSLGSLIASKKGAIGVRLGNTAFGAQLPASLGGGQIVFKYNNFVEHMGIFVENFHPFYFFGLFCNDIKN